MNVTGGLAALGLLLSALYEESLWIVLGAFFVLRLGQAMRGPIYSQLKNDLIPSKIRATTLSLISVLDSAFDLIVFGILSVVAYQGITGILLASSALALIGTLTPIKRKRNNKTINTPVRD